jgi:hypothetical protein
MGIDQLVNAYKGNPQPLQAKVQQAQKGQPPGAIPPDLEEAIALQKITELRNSAQAQQAMQAGGAQPSIVEKLRQMLGAEQRQQAQPPQMPQMAQGPQAMPQGQPPMPQGPQGQPPMPQGQPVMAASGGSIDQLMSNIGRHYAGGGIVSFFGGGDTMGMASAQDQELANQAAELAAKERNARTKAEKIAELQKKVNEFQYAAPELVPAINAQIRELTSSASSQKPSPNDPNFRRLTDPRATGTSAVAPNVPLITSAPSAPPAPRPPAGGTDKAPMPAGLTDLANLPSVGVGRDFLQRTLAENQKFDPKAYREQFLKEVGTKDLSVYDEMAEELKARKERLNAPKAGFDSLMEYLGAIAQSGGGRNWMEAGAKGAATLTAAQKARQAQQDALVDKILDLGSKKKEAEYNERLGMFNLTKAEKDKINKDSAELAKSLNMSETEAEKMRQQAIENELNRKAQIRAASIGAQDRDNLMSRARALMAVDKTLTLEEAMRRAALAANAASVEGTDVRRSKAYLEAKEKIKARYQPFMNDTPYGMKQKALYEKELADLDRDMGVTGSGINTLPGASSSGTVPAAGTVMNGYKFKGGNPADKNNWEKV